MGSCGCVWRWLSATARTQPRPWSFGVSSHHETTSGWSALTESSPGRTSCSSAWITKGKQWRRHRGPVPAQFVPPMLAATCADPADATWLTGSAMPARCQWCGRELRLLIAVPAAPAGRSPGVVDGVSVGRARPGTCGPCRRCGFLRRFTPIGRPSIDWVLTCTFPAPQKLSSFIDRATIVELSTLAARTVLRAGNLTSL